MIPQVRTLNYIRAKDPKHAEAFDDLITAMGNLPSFSDLESVSGVINGANKVFYLKNVPIASSLHLYKTTSGSTLLLLPGDYTLSGKTLTLATAPASGSTLAASYRY